MEQMVLPRAGGQTPGQLRAALRRAVIAADPGGAERRREEAERRARVCLYGDEDHTATLTGSGLPAAQAAAAMARITALARAVKASGAPGGIGLHRAQVFIGLLLGTLPFIPPADGAPTEPPPDVPPGPHPTRPSPAPARLARSCHLTRLGRLAQLRRVTRPARSADPDDPADPGPAGPWDDVPFPGDEDAPLTTTPTPPGHRARRRRRPRAMRTRTARPGRS